MKERHHLIEHFEMLELGPDADFAEVHKAWLLLKEIYSTDSLATMSLAGEFGDDDRRLLLDKIENSYQALTVFFNDRRRQLTDQVQKITAEITDYDGATLRRIREELQIPLDDVAMATRVPRQHLANIEKDNYAALPVPVYCRGFVVSYARHLSLDAERVAESFMEKFRLFLESRNR